MAKEQHNNKPDVTTKDDKFKISLSSEDINNTDEKIRKADNDVQVQNNCKLISGVILLNTCTSCDIKFVPKNSMTYETLCGSCVAKKQKRTGLTIIE